MRKIIGWPLAWVLYGVGHLAYLFIDRVLPDGDGEPDPVFRAGYRLYQRAMAASLDVNDWAGLSIWTTPEEWSSNDAKR